MIIVVAVPLRVIHQRHQADADDEREASAGEDREPAPGRNIDAHGRPLVVGDPENKGEQGQQCSDRERSCHVDSLGWSRRAGGGYQSYGEATAFSKPQPRRVERSHARRYGGPTRRQQTGYRPTMTQNSETTLRKQITECTRMMVMAELLDYSGHVSARIP